MCPLRKPCASKGWCVLKITRLEEQRRDFALEIGQANIEHYDLPVTDTLYELE